MKKFILLLLVSLCTLGIHSQDRVDKKAAQLSSKSCEITNALYWKNNSKTGKWESRKNTKFVYEGEGVRVPMFHDIFIGQYEGYRYLFIDYNHYRWKYPNLEEEWVFQRNLFSGLLTDEYYNKMDSIQPNELLIVKSRFTYEIYKGSYDYSFPLFLSVTETLRSSSITLYDSYKKSDGENIANAYLNKENPLKHIFCIKRVETTDGKDVVRFAILNDAYHPELIDSFYFEIEYSDYRLLFTQDKKVKYSQENKLNLY